LTTQDVDGLLVMAPDDGQADGSTGAPHVIHADDAPLDLDKVGQDIRESLADLQEQAHLGPGALLVVGGSTSEVVGKRIGTATSLAVGEVIAREVIGFAGRVGCDVAFQCCEHLNRALVVRKSIAAKRGLQEVMARPVPGAGGAMAASAYLQLQDACLVESVSADAGIDIGDTLIGMHLKRVVVPVRGRRREIGQAHLTMARTRPPLIGGSRAVYDEEVFRERLRVRDGAAKLDR
jgi:uncharacterized protein (TIGR01440 family)